MYLETYLNYNQPSAIPLLMLSNKNNRLLAWGLTFVCTLPSFSHADDTIAVIGAMDVEIEKLMPEIKNRQEKVLRGHTYYTGTLRGDDVVVTHSGIGKVNAAVTASELVNRFSADAFIFTGIAGAVHPELEPEDVVISTSLVQHDVDLTAFGYKAGHMSGFEERLFPADPELITEALFAAKDVVGEDRVHQGIIATGDQFVADKQEVKDIHKEFNAMAVEMEGAAVAQVAFLYDKPLVLHFNAFDGFSQSESIRSKAQQRRCSHLHQAVATPLRMLSLWPEGWFKKPPSDCVEQA